MRSPSSTRTRAASPLHRAFLLREKPASAPQTPCPGPLRGQAERRPLTPVCRAYNRGEDSTVGQVARKAAVATLVVVGIVALVLALWKLRVLVSLFFLGLVIAAFFTFAVAAYWIFERDRARRVVLSLVAREHRKTIRDTWDLIDAKLGAFVRGQLVLIAFVGTVLSLAFWAIGVPFWLLLGIFAGVVEIIPIIGPLTAGGVAIGVGLTDSWQIALAAGLVVLVVRLLEDYIVVPRVFGH